MEKISVFKKQEVWFAFLLWYLTNKEVTMNTAFQGK